MNDHAPDTIGVDISKAHLDVHRRSTGESARFSLHRLAHYCLDLAELLDTDRVVPVSIFLRAGTVPESLVPGTERRS